MATNLLLEGADLESLLLRAKTEGGAGARIVRAEKVRHGGVLGFFAKERFEVAVEIPDGGQPATAATQVGGPTAGSADAEAGRPPLSKGGGAGGPAGSNGSNGSDGSNGSGESSRFGEPMTRPRRPGAPTRVTMTASAEGDAAYDELARAFARSSAAAQRAAQAEVAPAPPAPAVVAAADPMPSPGQLAAEGILGIADRVDAAERAATAALTGAPAAPLTAPLPAPLPAPAPARAPARTPAPAPLDPAEQRTLVAVGGGTREEADRAPAPSPLPRPRAAFVPASAPVLTPSPAAAPAPAPAAAAALGAPPATQPLAVPHEPPVSPVQPSTSRPEFTALLDQLRSGTRPGDPAPQAARRPGRVPVPPLERQGEPADPRLLVDRTALRGLGVPASWTSALPAGDRFSAVLSMLDRLPVPDVDPDADVVAVVGPAGTVRLEAHRTAVDLAVGDRPRPVVTVPASGRGHEAALLRARETPGVVVAVPAEALHDADAVNATLRALGATAVVVVVEAQRPLEETRRWLAALDRVDAIAVEGAGASAEPAAVLHLGRPVVRLDGIPIDAVTWAALLCARLAGGDAAGTAG